MNIKFFDGSMGTMLQSMGLGAGELPELLNLTDSEKVLAVHRAYAQAGSEYITTNTFGANRLKIKEPEKVIKAGVRLAKSAGKKVALDIGPTGKLLKPMGELDFEDAVDIFAQMINAGKDGSDLVLIETMSDTYEIKAAVLAAKENCDLPVFVTMIFDEKGRLLTGADVKTAVAMLEGLGVDAIGFNCGLGPAETLPLVEEIRKWTSLPIIVQPNAGLPESVNGKTVYNVTPQAFAQDMKGGRDRRFLPWRLLRHYAGAYPSNDRTLQKHSGGYTRKEEPHAGLFLQPNGGDRQKAGDHRRTHQPNRKETV